MSDDLTDKAKTLVSLLVNVHPHVRQRIINEMVGLQGLAMAEGFKRAQGVLEKYGDGQFQKALDELAMHERAHRKSAREQMGEYEA